MAQKSIVSYCLCAFSYKKASLPWPLTFRLYASQKAGSILWRPEPACNRFIYNRKPTYLAHLASKLKEIAGTVGKFQLFLDYVNTLSGDLN